MIRNLTGSNASTSSLALSRSASACPSPEPLKGWGHTPAAGNPATLGQGGIRVKQRGFERLVKSVKQAGAIRRGQLTPGRATEFRPEDVCKIRTRLNEVSAGGRPHDWR